MSINENLLTQYKNLPEKVATLLKLELQLRGKRAETNKTISGRMSYRDTMRASDEASEVFEELDKARIEVAQEYKEFLEVENPEGDNDPSE
jgi:hypothetical protein